MARAMPRVRLLVVALLVGLAAAPWQARAAGTPKIEAFTTPAGIKVWLKREPSIPMVAVKFAFRGGASVDPEGKAGLANLVSGLLDEGAGDLTSEAFQEQLDKLSINMSFDAGVDAFYGSLTTLTDNEDAAFHLLGLALNKPRFDPAPVKRIRGQVLLGIRQDNEDPATVAWNGWSAAAFPGHPYGEPTNGTLKSVAAITTADLKAYVANNFARDRLLIAAVGDIDEATLGRLVDQAFASLPATGAPIAVPNVRMVTGKTKVIEMNDPQSVIVFGVPGVKRHDPDFYAAYVLNKALGGGGLNTRLFQQVRKKRGLAYSVSTELDPYDHTGVLVGSAGTRDARAGDTLKVIRQVFANVRKNGITATELSDAKAYLTGSFPLRLDSNTSTAQVMLAMELENLSIDYLAKRNGYIDAVTAADVQRVARRLLDPAKLLVVVAGKPEGIQSGTGVE